MLIGGDFEEVGKVRRTILFVVVAILAVMVLPGTVIGQTQSSHGGPPSDMFMNSEGPVCSGGDAVGTTPVSLLPTTVTVDAPSHLVVYFTGTISRHSNGNPELVLKLQLDGAGLSQISPRFIERASRIHSSVTVMWTFTDVPSGEYTVEASAYIGNPLHGDVGAVVQSCALTAFVAPVV